MRPSAAPPPHPSRAASGGRAPPRLFWSQAWSRSTRACRARACSRSGSPRTRASTSRFCAMRRCPAATSARRSTVGRRSAHPARSGIQSTIVAISIARTEPVTRCPTCLPIALPPGRRRLSDHNDTLDEQVERAAQLPLFVRELGLLLPDRGPEGHADPHGAALLFLEVLDG